MQKKIILIRLDKIGDLICTLPADQVINENEYEVTWIVQKGLGQVVDLGARKRNYFELDKNEPKKSAQQLAKIIKQVGPDIAISFQAPWWVNFELFKARIPIRTGVKSQWHSFLFLNKAIRQKRSLAVMHELEYNLELVRRTLDLKILGEFIYFEISKPQNHKIIEKFGLQPQKYVVVHPGMMGSALNWKQSQYISFINQQLLQLKKVVLTGTASDEIYLSQIRHEFKDHPHVIILQSKLNLKELSELLFYSDFVVAPSTGVAHLAASVGASLKAIYSPIRVHHPRRWAARGPQVKIFLPHVDCPAGHECLKQKCPQYNCMDLITL